MTDQEILALANHPDTREKGFRLLVDTYQQRLYQVIRSRVNNHDDADDILQNTFLKVFRHLERFEQRAELFTWMYRIACNETINFIKLNNRHRTEELTTHADIYAEPDTDIRHLESYLETVVSTLPERQQMVFRMRYYDELSYKEIASLLDLTEGALKASFHHAVKKIEMELKAKQII